MITPPAGPDDTCVPSENRIAPAESAMAHSPGVTADKAPPATRVPLIWPSATGLVTAAPSGAATGWSLSTRLQSQWPSSLTLRTWLPSGEIRTVFTQSAWQKSVLVVLEPGCHS